MKSDFEQSFTVNKNLITVKFIEHIKQEIRYVVVTTGRGNPANIPDNVRVVPFSVLESTLFKKYPEKLVLVDAIMNILPSGGKETP